jgi:hypothetical protein
MFCDDHGVFFVAVSGQFRTVANSAAGSPLELEGLEVDVRLAVVLRAAGLPLHLAQPPRDRRKGLPQAGPPVTPPLGVFLDILA